MKTANCINLRYEEGEFFLSQKESGRNAGKVTYKDGYKKTNRGTGWASNVKPSRLILSIEVEGLYRETWVDHYFKENVGRLTQKRINAIEAAMPRTVNVHEYEANSGENYYVVDDQCLLDWQSRAGL